MGSAGWSTTRSEDLLSVRNKRLNRECGGFTLIELLIAVAIIAVLATIAIISFMRYIRSVRVVDAETFIAEIQAREEAYFQQYGSYCDVNEAYPALQGPSEPKSKPWDPPANSMWRELAVRPEKGHTFFSFNVRASSAASNHALFGQAAAYGVPPQPSSGPYHPWYYIQGTGDLDGDQSAMTQLQASSGRPQIIVHLRGK